MKVIVFVTKKGKMKKVDLKEVRIMGRGAKGITGIELEEGDEVVSIAIFEEE